MGNNSTKFQEIIDFIYQNQKEYNIEIRNDNSTLSNFEIFSGEEWKIVYIHCQEEQPIRLKFSNLSKESCDEPYFLVNCDVYYAQEYPLVMQNLKYYSSNEISKLNPMK